MKKMVAVLLTAVMIMSTSMAAFAADDQTVSGNSGTTDVKYTTEEAYTVTIPADVTLTATTLSTTGNVTVTDALLGEGKTLKITVESAKGYKLENGTSNIAYTLKKGDTTITADANEVLSVAAGTKTGSAALTFATSAENVANATLAGEHKDTLTFKVALQ